MGIKVQGKPGKGKGDIGAPDKKKVEARLSQFSDVQNKRVTQARMQSSNGFKGESLNDHGLPDGHKSREIIQSTASIDTDKVPENAKFRSQKKYADGVKGIKMRPKTVIMSDATSVVRPNRKSPKDEARDYSKSLSKKDDRGLLQEVMNNSEDNALPLKGKAAESADSLNARSKRRPLQYGSGTKGIKTKKMC